jgi:hypothetical protein
MVGAACPAAATLHVGQQFVAQSGGAIFRGLTEEVVREGGFRNVSE